MWKLCPWMKSHWKGATLICSHVDPLAYLMADLSRCHRDYMYGLQSQKYFLCVPLLKKLADPWSPWRVYWCSLYCSWGFPKVWEFFKIKGLEGEKHTKNLHQNLLRCLLKMQNPKPWFRWKNWHFWELALAIWFYNELLPWVSEAFKFENPIEGSPIISSW